MNDNSQKIRNIAIIAHVDHGKTTLVDALLKQSNTFRDAEAQGTTILDSNELERERGITIFSKNASIEWQGVKINIVDTPGHADFGGEVERIMNLVDACLLLVDAKEGPMPQTKFVLKKAIDAGHKIIVIINKVDRSDARPEWVLNHTFDLFIELGASDEQANFPVLYASALHGVAGLESDFHKMKDVHPLLDLIVKEAPAPTGDPNLPLQLAVVNVQYDNYKGKVAVGRIINGQISDGQTVAHIDHAGVIKNTKITALLTFHGLEKIPAADAQAGEIVVVAGIDDVKIGDTIADTQNPIALPPMKVEEPTVKMTFGVNTSPFSGKEGKYSTSRNLDERLMRELQNDVALKVERAGEGSFVVSGRGELHLAILIEKMRREDYELQVSRPQVIFKEINGDKHEPFELVSIECPEVFTGIVIEKMGKRKGEMKDMRVENSIAYLDFEIPTRGLIGYRNEFITDTKGQGIVNSLLLGYKPYGGDIGSVAHGSMVSMEAGISMSYALTNLQERGSLFIAPGINVYEGMIVGENARPEDMDVNPCKAKRLSNMRSKGDGAAEQLDTPRDMGLENALEYIGDDELVEVTPKNIRVRKEILTTHLRKRASAQSNT
ncbi:MAG: translational GTPase TypA [Parcubacteria group bacterium]|nr:MAG: translational GTPase TypA [Parcubacteria group bacterium]